MMIDLGELAAAEELVENTVAECRAGGDEWGEAAALTAKAKLAHVRGDQAALRNNAERAAQLFRKAGDDWGVLQATEWLIGLADMSGDYERAIQLSREGLRIAEELGMWPDAANRLSWLGWIALEMGDYPHARACCEQGLRIATEQGSQSGQVFATLGLAFAARRDGKLDLAEELLGELLETARRYESTAGHALFQSMVMVELGFLTERRGDPAAALALHLDALDVAIGQHGHRDVAWALQGVASALAAGGRADPAARILGAAAALRRSIAMPMAPTDEEEVNRTTAMIRAALGADAFVAAYDHGGGLKPEAARALATR
jgi:tetratricopeptide (TPR) repeat protein